MRLLDASRGWHNACDTGNAWVQLRTAMSLQAPWVVYPLTRSAQQADQGRERNVASHACTQDGHASAKARSRRHDKRPREVEAADRRHCGADPSSALILSKPLWLAQRRRESRVRLNSVSATLGRALGARDATPPSDHQADSAPRRMRWQHVMCGAKASGCRRSASGACSPLGEGRVCSTCLGGPGGDGSRRTGRHDGGAGSWQDDTAAGASQGPVCRRRSGQYGGVSLRCWLAGSCGQGKALAGSGAGQPSGRTRSE